MLLTLKITCLFALIAIATQDFKERKVYVWLLVGGGFLMSLFYFTESNNLSYFTNISFNLGILTLVIGILHLYSKFKLNSPLNTALGLGDVLFFISIAISFPITSFIILFTSSLIFSLLVFLFLKSSLKDKNVPLAGLQALFFLFIFSSNWLFQFTNLYAL
jgi:hypothetical protein